MCWVRGALAIHFSYQTESATVLTLSGHFIRYVVLLLNDQKAYQPHTAANRYIRACRRGEDSLEKFKASIRVGKETEVTLEAVNMVQATTDCWATGMFTHHRLQGLQRRRKYPLWEKALFMLGVRGQSGRLVGDHSKSTWLPHLQPWNRQCLCRFEGPWTSSSKVNTDVLCVDPTEPQNYIFSCTCVDLPTAPTTHPGPPPLQHGVLQQLHFNLRSQSRGCYEVPLWKAIEPHFHLCPSCSQSISQFSFFLCLSFFGKKNRRIQGLNAPLSLLSHFIWLHPPATFHTIECLASQ